MIIDERARHGLHAKLETILGDDAHTLMALLPPTGTELATRRDLDEQSALLRSDVVGQGALLRAETAELRTEIKTEMAEFPTEIKTDMTSLESRIVRAISESVRTLVLANAGIVMSGVGLAFVAARSG